MDNDRIDGKANELKGSIKEALGKLTGNEKVEAEGAAQKAAGKAQDAVGETKDNVRDAFKK